VESSQETSKRILSYFAAVRRFISVLSKHTEGKLANVPLFAVSFLDIKIGFTPDNKGFVFIASPDSNIIEDSLELIELKSQADLEELLKKSAPWLRLPGCFNRIITSPGITFIGDAQYTIDGDPLAPPVFSRDQLIGFGSVSEIPSFLGQPEKDAVDIWNGVDVGGGFPNYVNTVRRILNNVISVLNWKDFKERRIHRYLNEHRRVLLPPHLDCFFEVPLYLDGSSLQADFILNRGGGLPPMLIELESPIHKVLRKNGDLTAAANHASLQINDWARFIDSDPNTNASGDYEFLRGPRKERFVIIGHGTREKGRLTEINRFAETQFWTYHMLIENARAALNKTYGDQLVLLGKPRIEPF